MNRNVTVLTQETYDVLVIGGGMYGACAAWDAALRGLSVALIERADFGSGTSAHSFKMVHGGIRYLQHADFNRIRESVRERRALLRVAPHMVRPLPILIPTYGHGSSGKTLLGAGMLTYDVLSMDRNRGIDDPARKIPRCRLVSRSKCLSMFPGLDGTGLTGGGLFSDAQMFSTSRLVLAFVRSAAEAGARVANYVSAVGLVASSKGRVTGVRARDEQTGDELEIAARVVLNCAGPWAESLLADTPVLCPDPPETYTIDSYFLVDRPWEGPGLAVPGADRDTDAFVSRKARHIFIAPWRERTLVGVWHTPHRGDPDTFSLSDERVEQFIAEANAAYPPLALERADIASIHAGLVLSARRSGAAGELRFGKRSRIIDHAVTDGVEGLITVIGVRATTARGVAETAVDRACRKLGVDADKCRTDATPVFGGSPEFAEMRKSAGTREVAGLSPDVLGRLMDNHGTEYERVLRLLAEDPELAKPVGTSSVTGAEVVYAMRHEMAVRLDDVVFRRTDLGIAGTPGRATLDHAARLVAEYGGSTQDSAGTAAATVFRAAGDGVST